MSMVGILFSLATVASTPELVRWIAFVVILWAAWSYHHRLIKKQGGERVSAVRKSSTPQLTSGVWYRISSGSNGKLKHGRVSWFFHLLKIWQNMELHNIVLYALPLIALISFKKLGWMFADQGVFYKFRLLSAVGATSGHKQRCIQQQSCIFNKH